MERKEHKWAATSGITRRHSPIPMDAIKAEWQLVQRALEDGRIQGYDILGAVLIDGHLQQAKWIREFIASH